MPVIISIAHQKGGVGKSTLAINLASYFRRNEIKAAVVDADIQGSITSLVSTYGENNEFKDIQLIPRTDFEEFADLDSRGEEVLFIDTPPYLSTNLKEIFRISDYVLIPTKSGVFDLFAIEGTLEIVEEALEINPDLKISAVINMTSHAEKFRHEIREHLTEKDIDVMDTEIFKRIEFQRSLLDGSIFESKDEKAKKEISQLGEELLSKLQNI